MKAAGACWAFAVLILIIGIPWYGVTHTGTLIDQLIVWGMVLVSMSSAIAGNLFLMEEL